MKHLKLLLPLLLLLLAFSASVASAQDKSVVVQRRDADITINTDGSVDFVETWVVRFNGGPFRFAFRTIPYTRISSIVFQGVSENGREYERIGTEEPNTYGVESAPGERTLSWYFSPTTNTTRTFQLRYRVTDALRIYDGGDQFYWTYIEPDRGYTINASRALLHLPAAFDPADILAATYLNGDEKDGTKVVDGRTVEYNGGPFPPDTSWELRVQFPHGVVTQSIQAWQSADDQHDLEQAATDALVEQFNFYSLATTLLLLVGGALALLLMWFLGGRDRPVALPAEYINAPPADPAAASGLPLTPALAGTLIDEEANVRDVLATLVDWAQRGIINIRAMPQGAQTADPNDDFVYERIGTDAPPLQYQYERELMQRLWQGETSRNIGYIREKFTASRKEMFDSLYDELVRLGYFKSRPDRVRAAFTAIAWLLLILVCSGGFLFQIFVGVVYTGDLSFSWSALAPWLVLFVLACVAMYLARFMPRKSPQGAQAAARWNAFKRYLEHIEKYTDVAGAKDQFEKYLPYAVAFGLDKTWVDKFAAVDTPAPAWYFPPPTVARGFSQPSYRRPSSTTASRPAPVGIPSIGDVMPGAGPASGSAPGLPSLNDAASGTFNTLNSVSASFFSMLNTTASTFVKSNPTLSPSRRSFRSGGGGRSSWSGGGGGFRSFGGGGGRSFGGGGRRSGGGGRSGFG